MKFRRHGLDVEVGDAHEFRLDPLLLERRGDHASHASVSRWRGKASGAVQDDGSQAGPPTLSG